MLFTLAIFSGARQGELVGLKWTDFDRFNKQISIERTFNNGAWYRPKSRTSKRKIDIGPLTVDALKEWELACPPNDLNLIFPNEAGNPLDHGHILARNYWPALKAAGLPRIRFHDLRHTYASLLIDQGENPKYIQTQLGHSSPMVTLNIYAHLMNATNPEAACKLETKVFKNSGSKLVAESKKGPTI